ncbi:SRPBCC family protein [Erythrobacter sp. GH1-10]|uniref:SRPBCC family protein n=1 Tax=Erythrobacter sp. GH1-10 TaxID=3349334 RepID=UPI003877F908
MRLSIIAAATAALAAATPLAAEVTEQDDSGFVTRDQAIVEATPKEVWLALITPSGWWNDAHTWSGDAGNMTLTPQAGGCFCEKIPESEDRNRITLEGSVEHMRVIQAYPESALRMSGGLGPLQSEPVTGILTIAISEVEEGTRIVWEYNVGGRMRYEIPEISKAVDGVMSQQLDGLARLLGRVDGKGEKEETEEPETAEEPEETEAEGPSVDEAFGDLSGDGR